MIRRVWEAFSINEEAFFEKFTHYIYSVKNILLTFAPDFEISD
jgi:hypothetical protein